MISTISPNYQTNKTDFSTKQNRVDQEFEDFKNKLIAGDGTGSSLWRINAEKIEKLIEEEKQKLLKKYGLTEEKNPPLSPEAMQKAYKALNEELNAFIKELMEKLAHKDGIELPNSRFGTGKILSLIA